VVHGARSTDRAAWVVFLVIVAAGIAAGLQPIAGIQRFGCIVWLGAFALAWAAAWFVSRRAEARAGRVELDEERILFVRGPYWGYVPWSDVAGYRDGDADFVELVRKDGTRPVEWSPRLAVPTLTEKDRVAVLELLDRRGLNRIE
jgi:hypothetical protein